MRITTRITENRIEGLSDDTVLKLDQIRKLQQFFFGIIFFIFGAIVLLKFNVLQLFFSYSSTFGDIFAIIGCTFVLGVLYFFKREKGRVIEQEFKSKEKSKSKEVRVVVHNEFLETVLTVLTVLLSANSLILLVT